jgi:hypothetical protein
MHSSQTLVEAFATRQVLEKKYRMVDVWILPFGDGSSQ